MGYKTKHFSNLHLFYYSKILNIFWYLILCIFSLATIYGILHIKDNTYAKESYKSETKQLEWRIFSAETENAFLSLPYSTSKAVNDFTIWTKLPDLDSTSMLVLKCRYSTITAKINGNFIYASDISTIAGRKSQVGKTTCFIPLQKEYGNKDIEIRIELQNSKNSRSTLSEILLTSRNTYILETFRQNLMIFISTLLLIICGSGAFIFFILSYYTNKKRISPVTKSLLYLSIISIFTALWSLGDSHIIGLFLGSVVIDGIFSYFSLLVLTVCFADFFICIYGENRVIRLISVMSKLNMILQFGIFYFRITDLTDTLFYTHIIFALEIFYVVIISIIQLSTFESFEKTILYIGNILLAVFMLIIICIYNSNRDANYIPLALIAIIIYCIVQISICIIRFIKTIKRQAALHEAEKYAFTDQLTKLENRRAYAVFKQHLGNMALPGDFNVVYIDLNGLKQVNDNLGHGAGDEYITGASDIIKKVFYDSQLCCRMGGDEFLVVLKGSSDTLKKRVFYLESLVENWRGKNIKKLSLSYGIASAGDYDSPTFETLIANADKNMYKMKNDYYENLKNGKESFE